MSNAKVQLYLAVPFAEKDQAKGIGARWDAAAKKWYVPHGADIEPFAQWWPDELRGQDVAEVLAQLAATAPAPKPRKPKAAATDDAAAPAVITERAPPPPIDPNDPPPWL
ncbi:DUF5710 domain-containing protein [Amantichitinum ursilacus]|uniref:DNA primase TraC n=1 Tax=Amantichitinum ursilacus TaxID=857265 RepID=A0A0N1JRA2_9NEIS|nr:DUF5710 domain-containing protein [Amantichitinum ursilacus]KPC49359.1 DNA primase TraC [Amantichitinum ursilacus]